jgi:hypothetical protein
MIGWVMSPLLAGDSQPTWTMIKPSNTGIPGDYVHTIYVDELDRPWIPGYIPFWEEGGMARMEFDGTWTTISNVNYPIIASPRFNDIVADANGTMWIGSDHGLLRYDPEVGPDSFVRYDADNSPMPASAIFGVEIDPDGAIWLAIDDVQGAPFGGLVRFDMATYKDGHFHWFGNTWPPEDPMTPMGLASNDPVDELGNMWIVLWAGLAKRAPDGTYQVVGYPNGLDTEVSRVYAASGGRAFLGTYMGDTYLYDNGWSYLGDWGGSHTYAFFEDSTGAFWTGGIGGSARMEDGAWQRYRLTNTGMLDYFINTIAFDDAGNVYMNGNAAPGVGGFDIFHGDRWTCVNDHNYGLGPEWGLPSDNSSALWMRANGDLAVAPGLLQGALDWDGSSYTYRIPQGYNVAFLVEDALGRLWGSDDYGIAYLVDENGDFTTFPQGSSPIPPGSIGTLIVDQFNPGYVLIAAQSGVAQTNGEDWIIHSAAQLGVPDSAIRCVDQAADGSLWVGTDYGMVHYDPLTQQSTMYSMANTTLPSNEIDHVAIAPDGSVWMSTFDSWYPYPGGLTHFDGLTWTTYTEENSPLPLEQVWDLESRAIPGGYEVWVGTAGEAIALLTITTLQGDVNGDGAVNIADLLALLAAWGPCAGCPADVNGDGTVNIVDLLTLLANWS